MHSIKDKIFVDGMSFSYFLSDKAKFLLELACYTLIRWPTSVKYELWASVVLENPDRDSLVNAYNKDEGNFLKRATLNHPQPTPCQRVIFIIGLQREKFFWRCRKNWLQFSWWSKGENWVLRWSCGCGDRRDSLGDCISLMLWVENEYVHTLELTRKHVVILGSQP